MKSNHELDQVLDKVTAELRSEQVDPATVEQAAQRVWKHVAAAESAGVVTATAAERIESCNDFQSLIPAYLDGELSEARSLLLIDHTHECIPCRKAMKQARVRVEQPVKKAAVRGHRIQPVILRWGIAAVLVIGFGLLALPLIQRYSPFGGELEATVQAADGQVYQIADVHSAPVSAGERLQKGDRLRTAKDAHANVKLGDGSTIEMRERSELFLTKNAQGTTIHLNRGAIVVEAAKQKDKHLFVDTGDSLISVTGTIFSVNNGTKGSRVSVVEGEVHLDHADRETVLHGGEQATTNASIDKIPVKDELAWSRKASNYAATLAAVSSLNKELNRVPQPGVRNSTHLLDLMPEDTIVYAALPNLTSTIVESHRIMQERINQNAALKAWWEKEQAGHNGPNVDQVINSIREFGDYLGEEVAVSVSLNEKNDPAAPLVLAELKNSNGLQAFIEEQIAKYAKSADHPDIRFINDPLATAPGGDKKETLYVWIQNDLFAASPDMTQLQKVAGLIKGNTNAFVATPFRNRIAEVYQQGAGLVVAANLERVLAQTKAQRSSEPNGDRREEALDKLGVLSVKYLVLDQNESEGKTHTRASLSFNDAQHGIPSWLAAPGAMGSLDYISPDANLVAGFVVKDPVKLVDDLLGAVETVSPDLKKTLDQQQADRGLDIRKDIAAPLGGEFAFAIDGPILPTPSWKMVFEVNDPAHLQQTLERLVGEVNKEAAKFGKSGLAWDRTDISGRTYYTLRSADFGVEVNYTFVNGYVVMGPSRAMVERAVRAQESGYSLVRSSRFTAGLPTDGNTNFSAVFYQNIGPLVQPFAERVANSGAMPQEQQQAIKTMAANMAPTLAYAYAQNDSITISANTEGGPFGISPATLFGMPNSFAIQHVLLQGMKHK
ncbi:MAG TPA: FecR domain-containing protein [Pyrinomonadaceae bacterium]|nr:FecR domain-containing protein [Pyrinomonadaceae bacterium]